MPLMRAMYVDSKVAIRSKLLLLYSSLWLSKERASDPPMLRIWKFQLRSTTD